MRLIDADEFERRIKKYDTTDYADKALYNFAHNEMITMPTVCDIDAIRREIEDLYIITNPASDPYDGGYYTALIDVRRIIAKYTK